MPEVIQQMLDAVGGVFDSPIVQLGLRAIGLYIAAIWLATAYWAFRDMQLRTTNPILPYFAASLIILFTPIFFIFGVLTYRIVRPQEKIGETYERTLAEEALLAEVESVKSCPTCARRVDDEWIICPTCRTRLNRVCPNCSRLVGLDWSLCAWCGRDFERVPNEPAAVAPREIRPAQAPRPASSAALAASVAATSGGQGSQAYRPPATASEAAVAAPPVARSSAPAPSNGSGSSSMGATRTLSSNGSTTGSMTSAAAPASASGGGNRSRMPFSVKRPAGVPPAGKSSQGSSAATTAASDSLADD